SFFFFSQARSAPPYSLLPYTTLLRSAHFCDRFTERCDQWCENQCCGITNAARGMFIDFNPIDSRQIDFITRVYHCSSQSCTFSRRSEEHTSELQSRFDLVCRLLLAT